MNTLTLALMTFILAIVSAVLGFGGVVPGMAPGCRILFFVLLVLFVGLLLADLLRPRKAPPL